MSLKLIYFEAPYNDFTKSGYGKDHSPFLQQRLASYFIAAKAAHSPLHLDEGLREDLFLQCSPHCSRNLDLSR